MTVTTERTRVAAPPSRLRRALLGWGAIVAAVVALALIGTVLAGDGWAERDALDPESAGPAGTGALARILVDQGIDVRVTRDRASALAALDGEATLVMPDAPALSDEAIAELASAAGEVVMLEPRSRTLRLLLPGAQLAGSAGTDELAPACDLAVAQRAGGVIGGSLMTPGDGITGCYPSDEGFALLVGETGPTRVTAVDGRAMFANDVLAEAGNAALALGIVGAHPRVVWYVPSLADSDMSTAAPTLGELTPRWVTPALVLLLLAAVAAGFWRGRRFGPLVVENLPVMVRASETTAERARLYARAHDPGHALDQLRLGALERLARTLGLSVTARPESIVDAVAARLGSDRASVRSILIDTTPRSDGDLVEWAAGLRDLEARVHAAVRPERNTP